MDRRNERLLINSIHAETGAPRDKEVSSKIGETIEHFAEFLEANEVVYSARVPRLGGIHFAELRSEDLTAGFQEKRPSSSSPIREQDLAE